MGFVELLLLSVGLAMDAFAVSICKGLASKKVTIKISLICGLWFGIFQGLMPFIGYFLGASFEHFVSTWAPWIAFVLLAYIGFNMIKESREEEDEEAEATLDFKTMFVLAVATSIDALAVGIAFAMVPVTCFGDSMLVNIILACLTIAIITCIISCAGVYIGFSFGTKYKSKAEIAGGIILILIGLKIILDSFGIL